MENYYGMRRKRNISLSGYRQEETQAINLNGDVELEEGEELELEEDEEIELEEDEEYEEIENENDKDIALNVDVNKDEGNVKKVQPFYLDGKLFVPKGKKQKQSFADTHVRVTTYLEKNIHQIIKILHEQGQIESITKLINNSIKSYLLNEYNNHKS